MQSIQYPNGEIETEIVRAARREDAYAHFDRQAQRAQARGGVVVKRGMIGRNSPCPCGSGRKLKKCCIVGAPLVSATRR